MKPSVWPNASRPPSARFRKAWIVIGAVAMGFAIWSMHYVGILAFRLPVEVRYDVSLVLWSMLAYCLIGRCTYHHIPARHNEKTIGWRCLLHGFWHRRHALHRDGGNACRLHLRLLSIFSRLVYCNSNRDLWRGACQSSRSF